MSDPNESVISNTAGQKALAAMRHHDALLDATHALEAALASPAPNRLWAWKTKVMAALQDFQTALGSHITTTESPDGLFGDVEAVEPNFHRRIERLRHEHGDLLRQAEAIGKHLSHHTEAEALNFHDIRQRCGWLLTALRHHQALEADLVFELYDVDAGVGD